MAKKPVKRSWDTDIKVSTADFFKVQVNDKQAELGRNDVFVGSEAQRVVIGLPLRAFCLRWGFMNDVFPLSRMTELYGISESCKTALLFEMFRWHLQGQALPMHPLPPKPPPTVGGYCFNLAEPRDSPDLRSSILGEEMDSIFPVQMCSSVEDWQDSCTNWMKRSRETFSEIGAMPFPMALGIDSLTGVTTRDEITKIWESGHAVRNFAIAAGLINTYSKFIFQEIRVWPVSFIGTNHMKVSKNSQGFNEYRVPGGASLDFYATFKIRMRRKDDIDHLDDYGRLLTMQFDKNSLSPAGDRRTFDVHMRWVFDDKEKQHTWWDWHDASVQLLLSFEGARKSRWMEICPIEAVNKATRKADCSTLGLKKASWAEIGEAIENEQKIRDDIDKLFGIRKRREFRVGVPYIQQIQEAMEAGDVEAEAEGSEVPQE